MEPAISVADTGGLMVYCVLVRLIAPRLALFSADASRSVGL